MFNALILLFKDKKNILTYIFHPAKYLPENQIFLGENAKHSFSEILKHSKLFISISIKLILWKYHTVPIIDVGLKIR